jgi:hypothetical protein
LVVPPRLAAALCALDAVLAHQSRDAVTADLLAGSKQRLPHPPGAVGEVVGLVQLFDLGEQALILDGTSRAPARGALVIGGRRHA